MEESVGEKLLEVAFHSALGQQLSVYALAVELSHSVDLDARRVLHGQDLCGSLLPIDPGHAYPAHILEVGAESVCILAFQLIVNFLRNSESDSRIDDWFVSPAGEQFELTSSIIHGTDMQLSSSDLTVQSS